jgi:branched-chain amino acid transport system ATP-binding protein
MSAPLLQAQGVHAGYGARPVLFGVDVEIGQGEIVALLGRNGMGKTTFVRSVMGLVKPSAGTIRFDGCAIDGAPSHRIARLGLALVPEGRQVFPNLSVEEHLTAFQRGGETWTPRHVFELFPRLAERRRHFGAQLSGGEQQMLAIGRALVTHPRLLILDEATEGLAPLVREEIWHALRMLRETGHAMLVIDKYVRRLIDTADRHVIVDKGRVVWQGSSAALEAEPGLWVRYLGV